MKLIIKRNAVIIVTLVEERKYPQDSKYLTMIKDYAKVYCLHNFWSQQPLHFIYRENLIFMLQVFWVFLVLYHSCYLMLSDKYLVQNLTIKKIFSALGILPKFINNKSTRML